MHLRPLVLLAFTVALSAPAGGQGLPFPVTIVDWTPDAYARQERAYRQGPSDLERLFCVTGWRRVPSAPEVERFLITEVRAVRAGSLTRIADVADDCLGRDGVPHPMLHTHADGNCQHSPADLVTLVARNAPFEGIQCGRRHFVWRSAWEVQALAEAAERAKASRTP